MKTMNLQDISIEEQTSINGGSEFSQTFFRVIGWLGGAFVGAYESVDSSQRAEIAMGLSPRNS